MQFTGKFGSNKKKCQNANLLQKPFILAMNSALVFLTYSLKGVKEKKIVHP